MAQPGVYRDGMQCPRRGSNRLPNHGRSRGKQTWRCRQCFYHFIPETQRSHQPEQVKSLAVAMCAGGNSIEAIARMPEVKTGTVCSWVKKACQSRNLPRIVGKPDGSRWVDPVLQRGRLSRWETAPRPLSSGSMRGCRKRRMPRRRLPVVRMVASRPARGGQMPAPAVAGPEMSTATKDCASA